MAGERWSAVKKLEWEEVAGERELNERLEEEA
jgi:hypothetical protein